MRMIRRALTGLGMASLALIAAVSAAHAAPARPTAPAAHASFADVSCPSASFCLAVGSHIGSGHGRLSLAEEWDGKTWRVVTGTPGRDLTDVSCSGSSFCMVTGDGKGADGNFFMATWNGHSWRSHPLPSALSDAISCGSPKLCVSINSSAGDIEQWTGKSWRVSAGSPSICGGPDCQLSEV